MKRIYSRILDQHLKHDQQMIFLAGPRQVGKTTIARNIEGKYTYLTWDDFSTQDLILGGTQKLIDHLNLNIITKQTIIFDEIHKYKHWRNYLKSIYDQFKDKLHIIVTGSAKLDIYRKGADSLMGRYFPYRIHPLTLRETENTDLPITEIQKPLYSPNLKQLLTFGGFPDPYIKADQRFLNRWHRLRQDQLIQEDIRNMTQIQEMVQLRQLMIILSHQVGSLVNVDQISKHLRVSAHTISRWNCVLEEFYYCYFIKPYTKNITRSLLKTPKVYLWDWSLVEDPGARLENCVASHLLKAVHFWTDYGFGQFDLYYLRNKDKKEVDFLVTKSEKPWFLVEVKSSDQNMSSSLSYFNAELRAPFAFQVVQNMDYIDIDLFEKPTTAVVPLNTFLSQLP